MRGARGVVFIVGMLVALAIGPMAALADPGNGHGKPTPSPSPTESPSPSPEPTASWRDGGSTGDTGTAPAPDDGTDTSGGGNGGGGGGGGSANGSGSADETKDHGGSGIIKMDRRPFDRAPNNEPKVGCTFQVDFYNYPADVTARYAFSLWPPTGHEELAGGSITLDDDPSGGGQDLDGAAKVELGPALIATGIEPHNRNGWHVKVVVHARHTSGPDQKQKVFWVRECRVKPTPPATPTPPPVEPPTVMPPGPIAYTGSNVMRLVGLMFLLLFLGTAAMRAGRRLEDGS